MKVEYGIALLFACERRYAEIAHRLIEIGADVNTKGNHGQTALFFALENGLISTAKLLIEKVEDLNLVFHWTEDKFEENYAHENIFWTVSFNYTALLLALEKGYPELAQLLIEKGVDLNEKTGSGFSAFDLASNRGYIKIIQLLKEKGADVKVANK